MRQDRHRLHGHCDQCSAAHRGSEGVGSWLTVEVDINIKVKVGGGKRVKRWA